MQTAILKSLVSESTRDMIIDDILEAKYANLRRAQDAIGALKDFAPKTQFVAAEQNGEYVLSEVGNATVDDTPAEGPTFSAKSETKTQAVKK